RSSSARTSQRNSMRWVTVIFSVTTRHARTLLALRYLHVPRRRQFVGHAVPHRDIPGDSRGLTRRSIFDGGRVSRAIGSIREWNFGMRELVPGFLPDLSRR